MGIEVKFKAARYRHLAAPTRIPELNRMEVCLLKQLCILRMRQGIPGECGEAFRSATLRAANRTHHSCCIKYTMGLLDFSP